MTRIYIAGPITGRPDLNRAAFAAAATQLRKLGHDVVNPHDIPPRQHSGPCPASYAVNVEDGHSAACYLRPCMAALLTCDRVYMLLGWTDSEGACKEHELAGWAGIPVTYEEDE